MNLRKRVENLEQRLLDRSDRQDDRWRLPITMGLMDASTAPPADEDRNNVGRLREQAEAIAKKVREDLGGAPVSLDESADEAVVAAVLRFWTDP